jgi:predicted transcriptional regulator
MEDLKTDLANDEQLLRLFKALADANRLKMVGLLARQPFPVEQLAALLELRPSTVSHHLKLLSEAGLVSARAEGYYNIYRLEQGILEDIAHSLLSRQAFPAPNSTEGAYQAKVIKDYTLPDGSLKTIPAQRRKLLVVLEYIAQAFTPGVRYPEKQVNQILARYHPDTATLRRELVGAQIMARASGEYWLVETDDA